MIHKAKFENFKGLKDVEVTFDSRFTVLVGPNGTGKTSVLQGVELVVGIEAKTMPLPHLGQFRFARAEAPLIIRILDENAHGFRLQDPATATLDFDNGTMSRNRNITVILSGHDVTKFEPQGPKRPDLGSILRPSFVSSEIARPTVTNDTPPKVSLAGGGLPSLLGYLKLRDDELFDRIEQHFCSVLPSIRKLRIDEQSGGNQAAPKSLLFDTTYASRVPAEQMSDGTLYILALIVAVLGPHRPKTLLIDDIDMRLHPKAQYELVSLLKKFLEEFPDLQIIATSHSPYILDKLEPNEVRVTGLGEDGSVVIAPLTDHPSYEKWKDSMTPGEFWSHTGEEWLKKLKREPANP